MHPVRTAPGPRLVPRPARRIRPHITLGDGVQVTHSERRTVTYGRARERAGQDARRPFRTRSYGSFCALGRGRVEAVYAAPNSHSAYLQAAEPAQDQSPILALA